MKSLNSRIRKPLIIYLIVFPFIIIVMFNIVIRIYLNTLTRNELKEVAGVMDTTLTRELAGDMKNSNTNRFNGVYAELFKALRTSKLAGNIDLLLYSKTGQFLYSTADTNDVKFSKFTEHISSQLLDLKGKKTKFVRIGRDRYLILPYKLKGSGGANPTIVFAAQMNSSVSLLRSINLILIAIMLIGVSAGVFFTGHLSSRISKPISRLSKLTESIGKGNFTAVQKEEEKCGISEIDMLDRSIRDMAIKLEISDKNQKTFLQNASHELKTPLMSIQGYAEGISQGVLPDAKKAAEIICNESMRLSTLVEELLTLSRIESQAYKKELVQLNLCDVMKEYVQRLGGLASKQQRRLSLSVPDAPLDVMAEDTLLAQAVTNIVSNCLRYAKTCVELTLLTSGSDAIIRISDDGGGISENDLPNIFERFYKGKGGNFGLGLAIAKSSVEFLGGGIRAYNSNGAVFDISLPIVRAKN